MMTEDEIKELVRVEEEKLSDYESAHDGLFDRGCPEQVIGSAAVWHAALSRLNAFKEVLG